MSVLHDLLKRQHSVSSQYTGIGDSLLWLLYEFKCLSNDRLIFQGATEVQDYIPPLACKFNVDGLHGNLLAVADEEGVVGLYDTRKALSESRLSEFIAHQNAIFDIAWVPGGTKLVTGSGDKTVCLWDVVGETLLTTFIGHKGSVKSVAVKRDEPSMFVSGGRDGNILVWDTRCSGKGSSQKPVNVIYSAHERPPTEKSKRGRAGSKPSAGNTASVTAVVFHGDNKIASCGASDGTVKLWDMRRYYSSNKKVPPPSWHSFATVEKGGRAFGFNSLVSDSYESFLFASCTDDIIYKYSTTTLNKAPVDGFSGHKNSMFYVKACLSHDGNYLLSGSNCGSAFIWQVNNPKARPIQLGGHMKEVTAVDWCPTSIDKVATCSDDNDLFIWRINRGVLKSEDMVRGNGQCVPYQGEDHLKAQEMLKLYRETAKSEYVPTQTLNLIKRTTALKQTEVCSVNNSKEHTLNKPGVLNILSTHSVLHNQSQSPCSPTPQSHSKTHVTPRQDIANTAGDVSTQNEVQAAKKHSENSIQTSTEETPVRAGGNLSALGRKRKLELSTEQNQKTKKLRKSLSKRKVDTNSCSNCRGSSAAGESPVARKQTPTCMTCLRITQPSLQSYFKPKD